MKNLMLIAVMFIAMMTQAQDGIAIGVANNIDLLVDGDDFGNPSGTVDMTYFAEIQGKQNSVGFAYLVPQYQHASLNSGDESRYSLGIGYRFNQGKVFNNWLLDNASLAFYAGYGYLDMKYNDPNVPDDGNWQASGGVQFGYSVVDNVMLTAGYAVTEKPYLQGQGYSRYIDDNFVFGVTLNVASWNKPSGGTNAK